MPRTITRILRLAAAAAAVFLSCACTILPPDVDPYAVFRESRPRSILVLPPVNRSYDFKARDAVLATCTRPLAESGYYVIPAALSNETFRRNGIAVAEEAHAIPRERLREIFGADAALYITINGFGPEYSVATSAVTASASAKLVDLRSGRELWSGEDGVVEPGTVSGGNFGGGADLLGSIIGAAIQQAINTATYSPYDLGSRINCELFQAGTYGGLLYGPYHSMYGTD